PELSVAGILAQQLRYGENPHQVAAFYRLGHDPGGLGSARQRQGMELRYHKIQGASAAYGLGTGVSPPPPTLLKHPHPCGLAVADRLEDAYRKALDCDPRSAFGGVVAVNRTLDQPTAEQISTVKIDVVLAPGYTDESLKLLGRRQNLRVLEVGRL